LGTNYATSKRDKIWDSMTEEERIHYLATTEDKGNKRYISLSPLWQAALPDLVDIPVSTSALPLERKPQNGQASDNPKIPNRWLIALVLL
jgi:hypothetical protein